uniref:Uncharacterized protein n=1 Tax=Anopheles maculatus TaxID=74869 RepID=A0A182T2P9_9DIPT
MSTSAVAMGDRRRRPLAVVAPMHAGMKICKIEIGKCLLFVTLLTSVCFQGARSDEGEAGATPADPHPPPTNEPGKFVCICICLSVEIFFTSQSVNCLVFSCMI